MSGNASNKSVGKEPGDLTDMSQSWETLLVCILVLPRLVLNPFEFTSEKIFDWIEYEIKKQLSKKYYCFSSDG